MSVTARLRAVLVCGFLAATACGDSKAGVAPIGGDGDGVGDGDGTGNGDGDAGTDDGSPLTDDQGGPTIEVVTPTRATDPVAQDVVVGSSLKVQCKVTERSGTIDTNSILAEMYEPGIQEPIVSIAAVSAGTNDLYEATLPLRDAKHGRIYVGCRAADTQQRTNMLAVATFFDAGPSIVIRSPQNTPFFRKTKIPIVVELAVARLTEGDTEAGVESLTAVANGQTLTLLASQEMPGTYEGEFDLTDVTNPPVQLVIDISATNKRTPSAATRKETISAGVDARAPSVMITAPAAGQIVGNRLTIKAKIDDPELLAGVPGSGVNDTTVYATITGNGPSEQVEMVRKGELYEGIVPSIETLTSGGATQVKVNVYASDLAGNEPETDSADGIPVYPDDVPPFVSLDASNVVEIIIKTARRLCSVEYDPLGSAAANDLDVMLDSYKPTLRVLAWDRALSAPTVRFAQVNEQSVEIHVQSDPSQPMLIAGNDGKCDVTNLQSSSSLRLAPLVGVIAQPILLDEGIDGVCVSPAPSDQPTLPVKRLCEDKSDLTRVLRHSGGANPSAVYGVGPLAGDVCTGDYFELDSAPGWKCVVARASDTVGNESVSAPLRVCHEDGSGVCDADPPSCTDGCELDEFFLDPSATEQRTGIPEFIDSN